MKEKEKLKKKTKIYWLKIKVKYKLEVKLKDLGEIFTKMNKHYIKICFSRIESGSTPHETGLMQHDNKKKA